MQRQIALAALAFSLAGMAGADDIAPARARMAEALGVMAETGRFTITTTGQEQIGESVSDLVISTAIEFTSINSIPTVRLEQVVMRNGVFVHRIAGDGTRLWVWDRARNEYASITYQVEQGEAREDYLRQMLVNVVKWSPREASFNARLLQDTFLSRNLPAQWSPWTGPSSVSVADDEAGSTISCTSLSGSPSTVSYRVDLADEIYRLSYATIQREDRLNTGVVLTTLDAQVYYDSLPPDTDYRFVPPPGSKPRSVTLPQVGG